MPMKENTIGYNYKSYNIIHKVNYWKSLGENPEFLFEGLDINFSEIRESDWFDFITQVRVIWDNEIRKVPNPRDHENLGYDVHSNKSMGKLETIAKLFSLNFLFKQFVSFATQYSKVEHYEARSIRNNSVTIIYSPKKEFEKYFGFSSPCFVKGFLKALPKIHEPSDASESETIDDAVVNMIMSSSDIKYLLEKEYGYLTNGMKITMDNGFLYIDGKRIAQMINLGLERENVGTIRNLLTPFTKRSKKNILYTNIPVDHPNCIENELTREGTGYLVLEDLFIGDIFLLKKGEVFNAPYTRYDISWSRVPYRTRVKYLFRDVPKLLKSSRRQLMEQLEISDRRYFSEKRAKSELAQANEKLRQYTDKLEQKVQERTTEIRTAYQTLKETQDELVREEVAKAQREKELQTEKAMSGGLAHEGRNALMPAAIQIRRLMEYQENQSAFDILSNKSGNLLQQIIKLENEYNLPLELVNKEIIPIFREINDLIKDINKTTEEISTGVGKGLGLIDLFRTYSKTQEMIRGTEKINVEKIARDLGETYKKRLSDTGTEYKVTVIDTEPIITGDYLQIESIIKNLFLNALDALEKSATKKISVTIAKVFKDDEFIKSPKSRHAGEGRYPKQGEATGFWIKSGMTQETLSTSGETIKDQITYLRITVEDTGEGIPADQYEKIFQAFYTTKSTKGTGLGLSIVKRLVEIYEGNIAVESKQGKGTKFTVILKLQNIPPL